MSYGNFLREHFGNLVIPHDKSKHVVKASKDECLQNAYNSHPLTTPKKTKRGRRGRKVIWYNPPWSSNIKTPIARIFLRAIEDAFQKDIL